MSISLALDHLTVTDATPSQLIELAAVSGCQAVCLFLQPMSVLPRMPQFALLGDTVEHRETRRRCNDLGIRIDLAYPFTLAGRTQVDDFRPLLETAASLEVRAVNALVYDRDPQRREDNFAHFCALAAQYGLSVALEFYPLSQIRTLGEALELVCRIGRPGVVGVNVDLLHLVRSAGDAAQVAVAPPEAIQYAQYCDGPATLAHDQWAWEASFERMLPAEGVFELQPFAAALPRGTRCSVEVPQERAIEQGVPAVERASRAVVATRRALAAAG